METTQIKVLHRNTIWLLLAFLSVPALTLGQNINSAGVLTFPEFGQSSYMVGSGQTVNLGSAVSVTLNPGVTLSSGSTVTVGINSAFNTTSAPNNPALDLNLNWVYTRTYDENGNEIGASKAFFDNNGKPIQTQTKNETTGQVLAAQTVYDVQGKGVLSTLAAPINNSAFAYNAYFVTNSTGAPYDYTNFDWNSSNGFSKTVSPDIVNNSTQGSLGWYYSNNNTLEPMVGATGYPYTRSDFYHDGTAAPKRAAGIAEALVMGGGHETTSNSFPVQNELNNYLSIRNKYFPSATVGSSPSSMAGQALQELATDPNGTSALSVTDLAGNQTLMSARADGTSGAWLSVNNTLSLSNVQPIYSITLSIRSNSINSLSIASTNTVTINANWTGSPGCNNCQVYSGIGNAYVFAGANYNTCTIMSAYPFTVSASNPASVVYDQAEATYQEPTGTSIQYFQLAVPSVVNITGSYTLYNMATELPVTGFNSGTQLPVGYYKIIAATPTGSSPNNVTVNYINTYSDISYNFYNQLGQLIASIAPNGVQLLIKNGLSGYTSPPFVTTYQYDLQGRVISGTTTDATGGASTLLYRTDGNIRFSQNALQAHTGNPGNGNYERFSYTNYDSFGRPIEGGEYAVTTPTFSGLSTNATLLDATGSAANITGATKLNQVIVCYDQPATNPSPSGYPQDPGFMKGNVSYESRIDNGTVTSSTWYNYDDHGRVTWMVKQIPALTGLSGYKTIDYTYDPQGNVATADYQKGTSAERFTHYYSYDLDGRLVNVQTSANGASPTQQANYYYYLHGPLKRTELGNQVQGLDYVYTPQGWLKAINSPSGVATNDPGKDGTTGSPFAQDAFGMQLEYFPRDYVRSNNVTSVPTGGTYYYSGLLAGMSWQSNTTTGANPPEMYTYTYDQNYQYTGSTSGTPAFTTSPGFTASSNYSEKITTPYDANGNIMGLQRTGTSGTVTNDFSKYAYNTNTNQLSSVGNTAGTNIYGAYTYDGIGRLNTQTKGTTTYSFQYDATGKITAIYNGATLVESYTYDESGNRIIVSNPTRTTYYVYDASGNVLAIYYGSTPTLKEVPVYGSGRLGTYFTSGTPSYVYELRDNVGSVKVAVSGTKNGSQATVYSYNDYYPYGAIWPNNAGNSPYRYQYQGANAESDQTTGYDNFSLRMYDPNIGRWLTTDPAGQFVSPYEGMGNNPVTGSDPTGGSARDTVCIDDNTGDVATIVSNDENNTILHGWWNKNDPNTFHYYQQIPGTAANLNYKVPQRPVIDAGDGLFGLANNPYLDFSLMPTVAEDNASALQMLSVVSMFVGGELFEGAELAEEGIQSGIKALAAKVSVKAAISATSQFISNGFDFTKIDIADVVFDGFSAPYTGAFLDAEFDYKPFAKTGPALVVGGYNKSFTQVAFDTGVNYLTGKAADHCKVFEDKIVVSAFGQAEGDKADKKFFGEK